MKRLFFTTFAVIVLMVAGSSGAQTPAGSAKAPAGKTGQTAEGQPPSGQGGTLDLANFVDIGLYYAQPYYERKDPATGFMLGGKNETAFIGTLTQINGRSIADLEKVLRPGNMTLVGSVHGFLGKDESLLEVLAADNQYVVDELGLTHQELARHLHNIAALGCWLRHNGKEGEEFIYLGTRFKVTLRSFKGYQYSPFLDDTKTDTDMTVENVATGKNLNCSLLVPYMIERYGFYEGKGTSYRVDPREIVEVLDFLKAKINVQQSADGDAPRHLSDARALVKQLTAANTAYRQGQGYPEIVWQGKIRAYCDCSGFLDLLLMHSYGYSPADLKKTFGSERPKARDYHDTIVQGKDSKLTRIVRLNDVRPGDILAVKYNEQKPQHTGHVMLVEGMPRETAPGQPAVEGAVKKWLVPVIDSSMSGHGKQDTRNTGGTSHTGVGKGMLCVYTNVKGEVVAYTWSSEPTSTRVYRQESYHMVIGRLVTGKK